MGDRPVEPQEDYEFVDRIVLAALNLPPEDRAAYVEAACLGDPSVRVEVESLLEIETRDLAAVDAPVFQLHIDTGTENASGGLPGQQIGPYTIEKELGRGGMAAVYLARRVNDPDRRALALKVLRPGSDNEDVVRSLRREGRILAMLDHPNIARVYGGGVTEDQRPYLVMEYIEGETLDAYLRHHSLGLTERLDLFAKICQAVEYAHGYLVVHSDLKPSNIVIDETGTPKLLDFGIARLLAFDSETPLTVTAPARRMLTPAYASPEQVRMQPISTASDVFALGVILYELLSGVRPLDLAASGSDWRREVCERDPPPPSQVVEKQGSRSRRYRRRLAGDLDAIAAKALRKEPDRRYKSVAELLDDLARYREGRPVAARRGSWAYRAGKMIRRRKAPLAVALGILLLLAGFLVDRQGHLERMRFERDRALGVQNFLMTLLTWADPAVNNGDPPSILDLLETMHGQLDEIADTPDVQVIVKGALGDAYVRLGQFDRAEPLLEASLSHERQHPDSVVELSQALRRLAALERERVRLPRARMLLEEAVAVLEGKDSVEFPVMLSDLGLIHRDLGNLEQATEYMRRSIDEAKRLQVDSPQLMTTVYNNLGMILYDRQRFAEAAVHFEALADERRQMDGSEVDLAMTLINLGASRVKAGNPKDAEAPAREAIEILKRILGSGHPTTSTAQLTLAAALEGLGRGEEALGLLYRARSEADAAGHGAHRVAGAVALRIGRIVVVRDRPQGLAELRRAVELGRVSYGDEHPEYANLLMELAAWTSGEEARQAVTKAHAIYRARLGEEAPRTLVALERLKILNRPLAEAL